MCPDDPPAPLRLVVADDHPIWREAVERDLVAAGLVVVGTAGDGEKAVRVCAATRPDVLVCDLQMPGLSGVEVARAVSLGALSSSAVRRYSPSTSPARPGVKTASPAAVRRTASTSSAAVADFSR